MDAARAYVGPLVREQDQPPVGQPTARLCVGCGRACWGPAVIGAQDLALCRKCGIVGVFRWHGPGTHCEGLVTPVLRVPGVVTRDAPPSIRTALIEAINVN
jgi:hypothetical protein